MDDQQETENGECGCIYHPLDVHRFRHHRSSRVRGEASIPKKPPHQESKQCNREPSSANDEFYYVEVIHADTEAINPSAFSASSAKPPMPRKAPWSAGTCSSRGLRDLSRKESWHPPRLATRLGATSRLSDGWNKFQHSTARCALHHRAAPCGFRPVVRVDPNSKPIEEPGNAAPRTVSQLKLRGCPSLEMDTECEWLLRLQWH